jgi:hypothetical protein
MEDEKSDVSMLVRNNKNCQKHFILTGKMTRLWDRQLIIHCLIPGSGTRVLHP